MLIALAAVVVGQRVVDDVARDDARAVLGDLVASAAEGARLGRDGAVVVDGEVQLALDVAVAVGRRDLAEAVGLAGHEQARELGLATAVGGEQLTRGAVRELAVHLEHRAGEDEGAVLVRLGELDNRELVHHGQRLVGRRDGHGGRLVRVADDGAVLGEGEHVGALEELVARRGLGLGQLVRNAGLKVELGDVLGGEVGELGLGRADELALKGVLGARELLARGVGLHDRDLQRGVVLGELGGVGLVGVVLADEDDLALGVHVEAGLGAVEHVALGRARLADGVDMLVGRALDESQGGEVVGALNRDGLAHGLAVDQEGAGELVLGAGEAVGGRDARAGEAGLGERERDVDVGDLDHGAVRLDGAVGVHALAGHGAVGVDGEAEGLAEELIASRGLGLGQGVGLARGELDLCDVGGGKAAELGLGAAGEVARERVLGAREGVAREVGLLNGDGQRLVVDLEGLGVAGEREGALGHGGLVGHDGGLALRVDLEGEHAVDELVALGSEGLLERVGLALGEGELGEAGGVDLNLGRVLLAREPAGHLEAGAGERGLVLGALLGGVVLGDAEADGLVGGDKRDAGLVDGVAVGGLGDAHLAVRADGELEDGAVQLIAVGGLGLAELVDGLAVGDELGLAERDGAGGVLDLEGLGHGRALGVGEDAREIELGAGKGSEAAGVALVDGKLGGRVARGEDHVAEALVLLGRVGGDRVTGGRDGAVGVHREGEDVGVERVAVRGGRLDHGVGAADLELGAEGRDGAGAGGEGTENGRLTVGAHLGEGEDRVRDGVAARGAHLDDADLDGVVDDVELGAVDGDGNAAVAHVGGAGHGLEFLAVGAHLEGERPGEHGVAVGGAGLGELVVAARDEVGGEGAAAVIARGEGLGGGGAVGERGTRGRLDGELDALERDLRAVGRKPGLVDGELRARVGDGDADAAVAREDAEAVGSGDHAELAVIADAHRDGALGLGEARRGLGLGDGVAAAHDEHTGKGIGLAALIGREGLGRGRAVREGGAGGGRHGELGAGEVERVGVSRAGVDLLDKERGLCVEERRGRGGVVEAPDRVRGLGGLVVHAHGAVRVDVEVERLGGKRVALGRRGLADHIGGVVGEGGVLGADDLRLAVLIRHDDGHVGLGAVGRQLLDGEGRALERRAAVGVLLLEVDLDRGVLGGEDELAGVEAPGGAVLGHREGAVGVDGDLGGAGQGVARRRRGLGDDVGVAGHEGGGELIGVGLSNGVALGVGLERLGGGGAVGERGALIRRHGKDGIREALGALVRVNLAKAKVNRGVLDGHGGGAAVRERPGAEVRGAVGGLDGAVLGHGDLDLGDARQGVARRGLRLLDLVGVAHDELGRDGGLALVVGGQGDGVCGAVGELGAARRRHGELGALEHGRAVRGELLQREDNGVVRRGERVGRGGVRHVVTADGGLVRGHGVAVRVGREVARSRCGLDEAIGAPLKAVEGELAVLVGLAGLAGDVGPGSVGVLLLELEGAARERGAVRGALNKGDSAREARVLELAARDPVEGPAVIAFSNGERIGVGVVDVIARVRHLAQGVGALLEAAHGQHAVGRGDGVGLDLRAGGVQGIGHAGGEVRGHDRVAVRKLEDGALDLGPIGRVDLRQGRGGVELGVLGRDAHLRRGGRRLRDRERIRSVRLDGKAALARLLEVIGALGQAVGELRIVLAEHGRAILVRGDGDSGFLGSPLTGGIGRDALRDLDVVRGVGLVADLLVEVEGHAGKRHVGGPVLIGLGEAHLAARDRVGNGDGRGLGVIGVGNTGI